MTVSNSNFDASVNRLAVEPPSGGVEPPTGGTGGGGGVPSSSVPSTLTPVIPLIYASGGAGMDPEVMLAWANCAFSQALGNVLANKANDMMNTINMINSYEGDAAKSEEIKKKVKEYIDRKDYEGLNKFIQDNCKTKNDVRAAQAAISEDQAKDSPSMEAKKLESGVTPSITSAMDTISAAQQKYITRNNTEQLQTQQIMAMYNQANQLASNMIAAYTRVQEQIVGNIRS